MDNRRDFLKKSLLLSGAAGLSAWLPESVQRAFAITPEAGSTYLDAEHVVILMQENRSFDHCFGTMQGVRGFNDPRAFILPNKNPVWLQTGKNGQTYAPFRLDIKNTKVTWMGAVPHSRESQVDAWNGGRYDGWIDAKKLSDPKFANIPMTMGYHTRQDIPFNYALADAFTICDQHFCSGMTSTRPNRSFFWSGTIRAEQNAESFANIRNYNYDVGKQTWITFPEILEQNGVSWRYYQNEIDTGGGFTGDERAWLANFGCNILEFFKNYQVKFAPRYVQALQKQTHDLPPQISDLQKKVAEMDLADPRLKQTQAAIDAKQQVLAEARQGIVQWSQKNFDKLSAGQKALFERAFTINSADPDYRNITSLKYQDNGQPRELTVPKGDIFYQFRKDVSTGKLPVVSWLSSPQNFSDHPSAPWYGAWYVSEVLDILTKKPDVWKKTIFILTYDENDGYFDHVVPFLPPDEGKPDSGKCSAGISTKTEHIRLEQEIAGGISKKEARSGPVGLGFRVPLIVASPWSRGGKVCSEVFDHTSTLQFLENFINKKFGKKLYTENISSWRRAICGDLSSVFCPYNPKEEKLPFLRRDAVVEDIYNAKFKAGPGGYSPVAENDQKSIRKGSIPLFMPRQEKGTRPACPLPYQLSVDGGLSADRKHFVIKMAADKGAFGIRAAGSPFRVTVPAKFDEQDKLGEFPFRRDYALNAGAVLEDQWPLQAFDGGDYHFRVDGPNGFYREFKGNANDPQLIINLLFENPRSPTGNLILQIKNTAKKPQYLTLTDHAYGTASRKIKCDKSSMSVVLNLQKSTGWYDFSVHVPGAEKFELRYAGRVETGRETITDPAMGNATG